jgi:hypothetical protein
VEATPAAEISPEHERNFIFDPLARGSSRRAFKYDRFCHSEIRISPLLRAMTRRPLVSGWTAVKTTSLKKEPKGLFCSVHGYECSIPSSLDEQYPLNERTGDHEQQRK